MSRLSDPIADAALDDFVGLAGRTLWDRRIAALQGAAQGPRSRRGLQQRHVLELTIARLRGDRGRAASAAELRIAALAAGLVKEAGRMSRGGRGRLVAALRDTLREGRSLMPLFHTMRTALLQRSRGYGVAFAGFETAAPFDLLLARDGVEAEIACELVSAEGGRDLHRGAWFNLIDRVDPDLQRWLAAYPGRYLLKMTLPQGLRTGETGEALAALHDRIRAMLASQRRADHDEAAVLRLDPLVVAASQARENGLIDRLREEFGPEAHLSVTAAGGGIFVMAARAGRENAVAAAVRAHMKAVARDRLTAARPGILAMFIEDTDRDEWRGLRERLELEGETRQFLTDPDAKRIVAVTCASRFELFGTPAPDGVAEGELRFRNPGHPAAKMAALAPAVSSSF